MPSIKIYSKEQSDNLLDAKQPTLVSGTNIKTINGSSILGSGDLTIVPTVNIKTLASQSLEGTGNVSLDDIGAQAKLVSGTSIKTINSTSLLGSGDVEVQAKLVSGTSIKTINSTSLLGSGNVTVQPTLVSGTNIKTVNGNSLLGSGNITVGGVSELTTVSQTTFDSSAWVNEFFTISSPSNGIHKLTVKKEFEIVCGLGTGGSYSYSICSNNVRFNKGNVYFVKDDSGTVSNFYIPLSPTYYSQTSGSPGILVLVIRLISGAYNYNRIYLKATNSGSTSELTQVKSESSFSNNSFIVYV